MPRARPVRSPSRAFAGTAAFRAWLERNHNLATELLVRCFKTHARQRGLTYPNALDEALCWGWIDGVRGPVDADSFSVRFSPRRPKSRWSAVNLKRVAELEAAGRLHPAGLAALRARAPDDSAGFTRESGRIELPGPYAARLGANRRAWAFFQAQAPWYRRMTAFWVMSAKREETREKRLDILITCCARGAIVPPLARAKGIGSKA